MPEIERKIYFYRADIGDLETREPAVFDPRPTCERINSLPFTAEVNARYYEDPNGNASCCWIDRLSSPQRVRIGNIRKRDFPQVETGGVLSPLEIPSGSGLAEQAHIVFFENNIVGMEFNFYAPRANRLADYVMHKASAHCPRIHFEPLMRQDVMSTLQNYEDIRLFDLRIKRSYASTISQVDDSLGRCLEAAAEIGQPDEVQIILKRQAFSRESLGAGIKAKIRSLLRRPDFRENATKFEIRAVRNEGTKAETVDLLGDYLISKQDVLTVNENSRAVDSGSAYGAIERAYVELRGDLEAAASVRA